MTNSGTGVADARAALHRFGVVPPPVASRRAMTPASKGRWLAFATVVLVATAWSVMASAGEIRDDVFPVELFAVTGFYVGLPIGVVGGTVIGRIAGCCVVRRWPIHVATVIWTLVVDAPPVGFFRACVPHDWLASATAMVLASLAIALPAGVMLEHWTRPRELVPRATAI
jgi:hypothetical protein